MELKILAMVAGLCCFAIVRAVIGRVYSAPGKAWEKLRKKTAQQPRL